ncbi:MAG: DUF4406 domain-containing protein [Deltaproteobacteria bacterium]|nr:DUF4406 domain-containing protein [Deltaproteobacteria bacterium]
MKRIYVAGSYNAENVIGVLDNIKVGTTVCADLLKKGFTPFCPWLDYNFHWFADLKIEDYYRYSMGWLEVSECVVVLPGSRKSTGTNKEIARAKEIGLDIYTKETFYHYIKTGEIKPVDCPDTTEQRLRSQQVHIYSELGKKHKAALIDARLETAKQFLMIQQTYGYDENVRLIMDKEINKIIEWKG